MRLLASRLAMVGKHIVLSHDLSPFRPSTLSLSPVCRGVSAHSRDRLRFDLIHDPNFSRLAKRVGLLAKILFCQCVDMRVGTGFNRARNAAADLHVAIGIVRVDDCERDRRARF